MTDDTTPGVCQICKAPNPGHHPWCDTAPGNPALTRDLCEPWRESRLPPNTEAVIKGGRLVSDSQDRSLGIMRPAVAALLIAAPRTARRLARLEKIVGAMIAAEAEMSGGPFADTARGEYRRQIDLLRAALKDER